MIEKVRDTLSRCKQNHLLKFLEDLSDEEKKKFLFEIASINWDNLIHIFNKYAAPQISGEENLKHLVGVEHSNITPLCSSSIEAYNDCDAAKLESYKSIGLEEIRQGRVAALVMAGGQGTRLGVDYPKGMFKIAQKSLFELQATRINKLTSGNVNGCRITWYIMTSLATKDQTRNYFEENSYFGLSSKNVVIFEQDSIPCFDFRGCALLDEKGKLSKSPNGNGGIFDALNRGIIDDMKNRGIEHVHVHAIDNVLVRVCDPVFIGYCKSRCADIGAKVVEKTDPHEAVGTICKVQGKFKVVEYSEISQEMAERRDKDSEKLMFRAGNICDQYFSVKFLETLKEQELPYHIAIKKIPHIDLETGEKIKPIKPNGIKLEKFIFDVFELSNNFFAWEVSREDEFSPLKNGMTSTKDNPETVTKALQRAYDLNLLEI